MMILDILNKADELAKAIKPINDSSIHIIYTFVGEVVVVLSAGITCWKRFMQFINPDDLNLKHKSTTRDNIIMLIATIIGFVFPLTLMILFWSAPHSIWWYLLQGFSAWIIVSFLALVFVFRSVNKMLKKAGI